MPRWTRPSPVWRRSCTARRRPKGDEQAAANLVRAARGAGVRHLVYISIVGVDRVPFRYYKSKLAVERLVEESGLELDRAAGHAVP
ncbi:hypothetical protein SALBM311S_05267 [Streptomyces alboniger]